MPRAVARRGASGALLLGEDRVLVVQRLEATGPQDRLAEPLQSEDQQERADEQAQAVDRQDRQRGAERGDDDRRALPSAAAVPMIAERQPRVTPTASTIVSASTISTAQARNDAATRNTSWVMSRSPNARCSICYSVLPEHDAYTTGSLAARLDRVTSPTERRVAEFLIEAGSKAAPMSAREIAAAVGTSDATVVRAAKIARLPSLRDLRRSLADDTTRLTCPPGSACHDRRSASAHDVLASAVERQLEALDTLLRTRVFRRTSTRLPRSWPVPPISGGVAPARPRISPNMQPSCAAGSVHRRAHSPTPAPITPTSSCRFATSPRRRRSRLRTDPPVRPSAPRNARGRWRQGRPDHRHAHSAVGLSGRRATECRTWVARSVRHPWPDHRAPRSTRAGDGRRRPASKPEPSPRSTICAGPSPANRSTSTPTDGTHHQSPSRTPGRNGRSSARSHPTFEELGRTGDRRAHLRVGDGRWALPGASLFVVRSIRRRTSWACSRTNRAGVRTRVRAHVRAVGRTTAVVVTGGGGRSARRVGPGRIGADVVGLRGRRAIAARGAVGLCVRDRRSTSEHDPGEGASGHCMFESSGDVVHLPSSSRERSMSGEPEITL